ncbi:MAG TPA: rhamnulokinase family protein, partial [Clostridia bacterium]|nr:rhamnulokinase family protein [Clostridia bacterium]
MKEVKVLGFDLGASSGRAILGSFDGQKIALDELHRFANDPVMVHDTLYWDILRLLHEIKQGILKSQSKSISGISIDTWGVDFGLIDKNGKMLENPVHYRDTRTRGMEEEATSRMHAVEIYRRTGIDFMFFNTLLQLLSLSVKRPHMLERADKLLYTPDLLKYFLTGEIGNEFTIASTSQILNPTQNKYDEDICRVMGIPIRIFPDIVSPGTVTGTLMPGICEELGVGAIPFITTASHDTAAAVAAVPAKDDNHLYISCGTWSLLGIESDTAVINEKSEVYNLKNIGGVENKFLPQKNVMGLWLLQESRRQWAKEGQDMGFADLNELAARSEKFKSFVDPDDMVFADPGNMPERIRDYCAKTSQETPWDKGATVACILQSLAMKYRYVMEKIGYVCGRTFDTIHIVGGGTQNRLLCQMTANATGKRVLAGPVEATALGNIAMQLK